MELFQAEPEINILPFDGVVNNYGTIFPRKDADHYFSVLLKTIPWKHDEVIIFGKHIITKRETAWYGDREFAYTYSGIERKALIWTNELQELKRKIELMSGTSYNSCLLNLYHNGDEGMSWHSDDEKMLLENGAIASVSFGAERKFSFKHKKTGESISLNLLHGSLLVMKGTTQKFWLHALPKSKKVQSPRVNLTFRTIVH